MDEKDKKNSGLIQQTVNIDGGTAPGSDEGLWDYTKPWQPKEPELEEKEEFHFLGLQDNPQEEGMEQKTGKLLDQLNPAKEPISYDVNQLFPNPEDNIASEEPLLISKALTAVTPEKTENEQRRMGSRANKDVVKAQAVIDRIQMEEVLPTYAVHGAKMICSMGTREARLVVPMDHGVVTKNSPQLVLEDSVPELNVKCFGNCTSAEKSSEDNKDQEKEDNPNMKEAAAKGVNAWNKKHPVLSTILSIFNIGKKEADPSKEMMQLCICECVPTFSDDAKWIGGHEIYQVGEQVILTADSTLTCIYGGVITIQMDGQEE